MRLFTRLKITSFILKSRISDPAARCKSNSSWYSLAVKLLISSLEVRRSSVVLTIPLIWFLNTAIISRICISVRRRGWGGGGATGIGIGAGGGGGGAGGGTLLTKVLSKV